MEAGGHKGKKRHKAKDKEKGKHKGGKSKKHGKALKLETELAGAKSRGEADKDDKPGHRKPRR